MFDPMQEVPNLELCRRLKELGYPQGGGGWYWYEVHEKVYFIPSPPFFPSWADLPDKEKYIKAPTVRELGEWLPYKIKTRRSDSPHLHILHIRKHNTANGWYVGYIDPGNVGRNCFVFFGDDCEANTRARMLIWLVENGYISFQKEDYT